VEYVIRRTGSPKDADIFQSGKLIASLEKENVMETLLRAEDGSKIFHFDPKVDGVLSPFSMTVYDGAGKAILKIKINCFSRDNQIYMFKSLPEGKSMKHHLSGSKYICRLLNFPYHDINEIDPETRERLSRHRGVDVGTLSGLGKLKHEVKIGDELADIGLPLSAASYLLYSTG